MGLSHSNFCNEVRKTHLCCNRVRIGRSRSSEVDDFGTNRKRICGFLLVHHCNYDPTLHRFWDTTTTPARNTLVQLLALYTYSESHNVQRCRQTDGQTDGRTDRHTTALCQ